MATKRQTTEERRGPGAPVTVGADTAMSMKQPRELIEAVKLAAAQDGVSAAEAWRRGALAYLEARKR